MVSPQFLSEALKTLFATASKEDRPKRYIVQYYAV